MMKTLLTLVFAIILCEVSYSNETFKEIYFKTFLLHLSSLQPDLSHMTAQMKRICRLRLHCLSRNAKYYIGWKIAKLHAVMN